MENCFKSIRLWQKHPGNPVPNPTLLQNKALLPNSNFAMRFTKDRQAINMLLHLPYSILTPPGLPCTLNSSFAFSWVSALISSFCIIIIIVIVNQYDWTCTYMCLFQLMYHLFFLSQLVALHDFCPFQFWRHSFLQFHGHWQLFLQHWDGKKLSISQYPR